ncbi:MAG: co-chaperone GroES [Bacilli bacterium]|jgi:chaperonin GroES|nr:co-chaperone GroES [Bacilli bacterium]
MIKPLADYVVLQAKPAEKKVGSIILATEDKNKSNVATVIAVGPGKKDEKGNLIAMSVKVGDRVLYKEYSTTDYKEGDNKYLLVRNEDIIGIVE